MTKRFSLVMVALLIVPMLLTACGTESRDVAEDYIKAVLEGKSEDAQKYACEAYKETSAAQAAAYGEQDINNIDLKYDIGKGNNQKEIIVTGSYDLGEGDDAKEVELAESVRDRDDLDADDDDEDMISTVIILTMKEEDGDWCVEDVEWGARAPGAAAVTEETEPVATEEAEPAATEEAPAATEEAAPAATEEAAPAAEETPEATAEAD